MTKELNILLIEDNPADARLIDIYLGEAFTDNYSLTTVVRLSEGLQLATMRNYDVILCDLALPDSYGMNTFNKIFGCCPHIPVIVLTGYGDDALAINAVSQGAADFLGKNNLDANLLRRSIVYSIERCNLHKQMHKIEELQTAKELAERTSKARQEFLSVMSHEIRTPLNAIIGVAYLLSEEDPTAAQKEHLNILQFSAHNLLVLVNNILDFSRIESGKIQLEKIAFNLPDLIHRLIESFSRLAAEKNIRLNAKIEPNLPEIIIGDPGRLTQILNNLLHNALKFTAKGEVILSVGFLTEKGSSPVNKMNDIELLFEVADTGIGIEHRHLEEIFESFAQARPSTARMFGGTGLGLTISKQLVRMMGGDLSVESELGKGSVFSFIAHFMIGTKDDVADYRITGSAPGNDDLLNGIKILVVEDNTANRILMEKFLVRWNAKVDTAENGEEAIEKIKQLKFDLVLMDIQMPGIDGYEASRKIREMGFDAKQLPVIALTASVMDDDKKKVFEAGMNDHIPKPVELRDLYTKIIKNIPERNAGINEVFFENLPQNHILSIPELLDSFEDDAFRREYLDQYHKEFHELPEKIYAAVKKNDVDYFSLVVHKITPNIMRIDNNNLVSQLSNLKTLMTEDKKDGVAIESLFKEIENSSRGICDRVIDIRNSYFSPHTMNKQSSL